MIGGTVEDKSLNTFVPCRFQFFDISCDGLNLPLKRQGLNVLSDYASDCIYCINYLHTEFQTSRTTGGIIMVLFFGFVNIRYYLTFTNNYDTENQANNLLSSSVIGTKTLLQYSTYSPKLN